MDKERRKRYKIRHEKDRHYDEEKGLTPGYLADKMLW